MIGNEGFKPNHASYSYVINALLVSDVASSSRHHTSCWHRSYDSEHWRWLGVSWPRSSEHLPKDQGLYRKGCPSWTSIAAWDFTSE